MITDEYGNEAEEFEVWYAEAVLLTASMYPSIGVYHARQDAESFAETMRRDGRWVCIRVTGPHRHFRLKPGFVLPGPREATAADLGLEAA